LSTTRPVLFYVVDWLPPVFGAVGQYAMLAAQDLARDGGHVTLIGLTNKTRDSALDRVGTGILEIIRIPAASYDKSRLSKRLAWTFRTNARLLWEVIRRPQSRGADLLFTGSPPFFVYFAVLAKLIRRVRLIYRIADFYPEVIIADRGKWSPFWGLLQRLTWFMRRRVDIFEVLGEDQRRILLEHGIAPERIELKRDTSPVVISGREPPLPRPRELSGLAVLLYSGNYGVAHDVDTIVEGLIRHHRSGSGRVGLWLNATGTNADKVEAQLRAAGVPCARTATVPLEQLPALLVSADAQLITLRPAFSGLVLPSKVYACIASGRPIIYVGPKSSDVHLLCSEQVPRAYVQIQPGEVAGFVTALEDLAAAANAAAAASSPPLRSSELS
jgi:hypothetical protein